jgi:integrase
VREKPWFRQQTRHWYIEISGTQHRLCPGESKDDKASKKLAYEEWHRLITRLAEAPREKATKVKAGVTVGWLANEFLEYTRIHCGADAYATRKSLLKRFTAFEYRDERDRKMTVGSTPAAGVRKFALQKWLDANATWSGPSRRMAINVVLTMLNWGVGMEYIPSHRLRGFKKPPEGVREATITPGDVEKVLAAVDDKDAFKDFLVALKLTGARPSELRRVTAADLRDGTWVLRVHKNSKKTSEPRVIYLPPEVEAMARRLGAEHPEGPIFRNDRHGTPWSSTAIEQRFWKLQKRLGLTVSGYLFRSHFCTEGLKRGVDVAHMATLLGHKSTAMVMRHYSRISGDVDHMRVMARRAVGG